MRNLSCDTIEEQSSNFFSTTTFGKSTATMEPYLGVWWP